MSEHQRREFKQTSCERERVELEILQRQASNRLTYALRHGSTPVVTSWTRGTSRSQIQRRHLGLQGNKSWSKIAEAGGRRSLEIIGVELSTREEWVIVDACREGKEINNIWWGAARGIGRGLDTTTWAWVMVPRAAWSPEPKCPKASSRIITLDESTATSMLAKWFDERNLKTTAWKSLAADETVFVGWEGLESGFLPFFVDLWAQKARDVYRQKRKNPSVTAKKIAFWLFFMFFYCFYAAFFL